MPAPAVIWKGPTDSLSELPNSPEQVLGEKVTVTRTYSGPYALCVSSALGRGTSGTGDMSGYVVSKCTVKRDRGAIGTLVIEWEGAGGSLPLPPDEHSLQPSELNPAISRHPKFKNVAQAEIDNVEPAITGSTDAIRSAAKAKIKTPDGLLLLELRGKGFDNYYLPQFRYTWTLYSYSIPATVMGGYVETPGGPLSGYLPGSVSWLRLADQLDYDGAKYRLTRSWLGGPTQNGAFHWDPRIYS